MKLTYRDIGPFLQKRPALPVVLIYGPDHGLIKERANILGRFVVADLNDPFNAATISAAQILDDPARLFDEANALSMMGGDRFIRITEAADGLTSALKDYLKAPSPTTFIVIEAGDLPPRSPLRQLCERDKAAVALPCYVQEGADLARMIEGELKAAGLRIDRDALSFFAGAVGGDQQQVRREIEKLITYMGNEKTITLDDVVACAGAMGQADLDKLIDDTLGGRAKEAMALLDRLQDEGTPEILMIRSFMAHGRRLQQVHLHMAAGEDLESALKSLQPPVFFKRESAFRQQLQRWPLPRLSTLLHDFFQLEGRLKSGYAPTALFAQFMLEQASNNERLQAA